MSSIVEKRVANVVAYNTKVEDIPLLIGDRYLVEILDVESVTESGIMLMDGVLSRAIEYARVLIVGNGDRLDSDVHKTMYFKKGDVIVMERLAGREEMLSGRSYRLVNQSHCYHSMPVEAVRAAEVELGTANQPPA